MSLPRIERTTRSCSRREKVSSRAQTPLSRSRRTASCRRASRGGKNVCNKRKESRSGTKARLLSSTIMSSMSSTVRFTNESCTCLRNSAPPEALRACARQPQHLGVPLQAAFRLRSRQSIYYTSWAHGPLGIGSRTHFLKFFGLRLPFLTVYLEGRGT